MPRFPIPWLHRWAQRSGWRTAVVIAGLAIFLTACFPGSQFLPPAGAIPLRYELYKDRYRREYSIQSRPTGSAKEVAEAFMRQYQPGPLPRIFEHSILTDRHGEFLAELVSEGRRTWVSIDLIPQTLIDAVVATEDASFFDNDGIDEKRLVGALIQNFQNGAISAGGSTITMQMARNLFFPPEKRFDQSLNRKITEIFLAQDLTRLLTKQEILEIYLNLVYFGNGAYGVEAASQTYFGKSVKELDWAQATLLAGLPQSPVGWDPYSNFDGTKLRQRTVLNLLVKRNYLTTAQADDIFGKQINLKPLAKSETLAPHFVRYVEQQLASDLNIVPGRAGLRVTTTLDLQMQQIAQNIVSEQVNALRGPFNLTNGALVALKPRHAEILVMVGSADFNNRTISGQVNIALSPRQPGSTMKAVLYSTAFNDNLISPSTIVWDLPVRYTVAKVQTYIPSNYDFKFHGPVTVRTAFANSYNVPAIKVIDAVGPDRVAQIGRAMGLTTLSDQPGTYNLPLTLGANEVTLLDLTNVFHTIDNGGIYAPYRYILGIKDSAGQDLNLYPEAPWWQAISPQAAFLATSIMSDYKARQPAFGANTPLNLAVYPAAAKTGTSSSFRDNWTVGFTRHLVVGVWAGNSSGRPMLGASGVTGAAPIWNKFLTRVLTDTKLVEGTLGVSTDPAYWQFEPPAGVVERELECPKEIYCSRKSEFYTTDWLEKSGRNGPTGDSIAMRDRVARVNVTNGGNTYFAGVCSTPRGAERTLLTLPSGFGQLAPIQPAIGNRLDSLQLAPSLPLPGLSQWQFVPIPDQVNDKIAKERLDAILWSGQVGTSIHFGPCSTVASIVHSLFGKNAVATVVYPDLTQEILASEAAQSPTITQTATVTVTAQPITVTLTPSATRTPRITPTPSATPTPPDAVTPTPVIAQEISSRNIGYLAANFYEDNNCPGHYILGTVLNADGGPVAGIHVRAVDQWGNIIDGMSKSGAADFGQWDIPIDFRVRSFSVVVLGDDGSPISPVVNINHQGDVGAKCHHIVWQRVK
ncbi:MAG: transglycosylase domain-containing protein [Caldilineaceae bacterium]